MVTGSAARIIRQIIHSTVGQGGGERQRRRGEERREGGGEERREKRRRGRREKRRRGRREKREERREGRRLLSCPNTTPLKGLVTIECFLGCAKSVVLVLNKPIK